MGPGAELRKAEAGVREFGAGLGDLRVYIGSGRGL